MTNSQTVTSNRASELANRLLMGATALEDFAMELSDSEWKMPVESDGRTIGVVIHHVASTYPLEIELAKLLASGNPITDATMDVVDQMNAEHAQEYAAVEKQETLEFLRSNSRVAAEAVKMFSNEELDNAAKVSLNANAPLTAQFFIEDHALRHSFHHLDRIKATLSR